MNFVSKNEQRQSFKIHYKSQFVTSKLTSFLSSIIPEQLQPIIIVCIGTDRSTGDALGPLVGSMLHKRKLENLIVFGTLHEPIHAVNLNERIDKIKNEFQNSFIIAIDAALGNVTSIGNFICGEGSLHPGAALNKDLPQIGNVYLSGVVNMNGAANYLALQSTRLAVVHDMATIIASCLYRFDLIRANKIKDINF